MQAAETKRPTPLGGILALVGGALLVIGSFLDWAEVSGTSTTVTASGTEGWTAGSPSSPVPSHWWWAWG